MAYSALQLITRSRTQGISTVELADATGYDAKAIHYLISQLETLGLMYVFGRNWCSRLVPWLTLDLT